MIAKASKQETNGSEGIQVLVNERFDNSMGKGIYTHKVIHLSQYVKDDNIQLFFPSKKSSSNLQYSIIGDFHLGLEDCLHCQTYYK